MIDFTRMTDDELKALHADAYHELVVRLEMARIQGTAPCPTIWGPGPPWYCVPRCQTGPQGHKGKCVPNMTQDEARAVYAADTESMLGGIKTLRGEALARLANHTDVI